MAQTQKEAIDLLVTGGQVVTMDDHWTVIENGGVAIRQEIILEVGPQKQLFDKYAPKEIIGSSDQVVFPGLVNAHTHAATALFRGFADDRPLKQWLEGFIWPAEATFITPETVYWGTLLAACEMVRAGVVAFLDMYFYEEVVARAAKETGIRAVLGEAVFDSAGPNKLSFDQGLDYTRKLLENFRNDPLVTVSVQPHGTHTVSARNLMRAKALADEFGVVFALHASETAQEVNEVQGKTGFTPVRLLKHHGLLGDKVALFHGVHLDDEEISVLAETKTAIVHCPESNLKLASGIARLPDLLKAGVPVGLGTDGPASNNDFDLWTEIQFATKIHRGVSHDPLAISDKQALYIATRGGANALGLGESIGSLQPGKRADLILIDFNQPHLVPMYDVYSHLAFAVGRADVNTTIVNGVLVMRDRQVLSVDETQVMDQVRKIGREIGKWLVHQRVLYN
ncbi:MAG: amidohydrolase [Anaerolineales bacterium]|nr:amidohydrolase [Anaerolineales bacterium]